MSVAVKSIFDSMYFVECVMGFFHLWEIMFGWFIAIRCVGESKVMSYMKWIDLWVISEIAWCLHCRYVHHTSNVHNIHLFIRLTEDISISQPVVESQWTSHILLSPTKNKSNRTLYEWSTLIMSAALFFFRLVRLKSSQTLLLLRNAALNMFRNWTNMILTDMICSISHVSRNCQVTHSP